MITKKNKTEIKGTGGEIVLYRTKDGRTAVDVRLEKETVWLTQKQMALLFDKDSDTVGLHIRNLYKENELDATTTTEESSVVQEEGRRRVERTVRFYNLDVVISVGYRVKSTRGTQFRIWATQVLKDHILKGYTLNEKRLQAQVARLKELQNAVDLMRLWTLTNASARSCSSGSLTTMACCTGRMASSVWPIMPLWPLRY